MNKQIIERGRIAQLVLELPEFKAVMGHVREDLFRQFSKTAVASTIEREDIHKMVYAVDLLEQRLTRYVSDSLFEINSAVLSES